MKMVIVAFLVILTMTASVNAFCFIGFGDCNKIIGKNPIYNEKDEGMIPMMTLRNVVNYKSKDIERELPLNILKVALPIRFNVYSRDSFSVSISKNGMISTSTLNEKPDIHIIGNEYDLKELFIARTNEELMHKITNIDITPVTFKGELISQIVEDYTGTKIVSKKSPSQKAVKIITTPVIGVAKLFL